MKKDLLALLWLLSMLAMIYFTGCIQSPPIASQAATAAESRPLTAISSALTVGHVKYVAYAGSLIMAAGILVAAFRSRSSGLLMFMGGMAMNMLYTALAEHPYITTILTAIMFLTVWWLVVKWVQTQRALLDNQTALKEAIKVIQPHADLKQAMCAGNVNKQNELRAVIDPLKQDLRAEGEL